MTTDIKSHVLSIVTDLEQGRQCESCTECGADLNDETTCPECDHENCEILSGFDYISDVGGCLDVNWILDSNRELKGARLLVAFGGPNIWIDTVEQIVEGHWWGDSFTASYNRDAMDIEGACAEWFSCA